jgi:alpha-beta hydrolase superfamily lysophospholipase
MLRIVPVSLLMRDQFHSDWRIARVTVPLLIMHGNADPAIDVRFGERLFALAHEPKQFVQFNGGGHENLDDFGAMETARQFIAALKG